LLRAVLPAHGLARTLSRPQRVTTIFRHSFTLEYEGDAVNVFSMDVLPDGSFVEADPPVEPITKRFYRESSVTSQSSTPGAAVTPGTP
jgi:hypothetical protein